jgi:SAM-dependent methyltransferase
MVTASTHLLCATSRAAFTTECNQPLFSGNSCTYRCGVADQDPETARIRRIYDRRRPGSSAAGSADLRWLCSRAEGDTLEIGVGRGRTLPYYSRHVRLSGIELSPVSLAEAVRRAREIGMNAALVEGDAAALPYPDEHFDTVAFCFSLCTIPDDRRAVAEAVRVLRPGGRLLAVEHVRSPNLAIRALERLFDPIEVWRGGDHLLREPLDHVVAEGLEVERLERRLFGIVERLAALKPDNEELAEAV